MRPLYICLATDENYAQLATVAITSVFEKNRYATEIEIYILDGGIKEKTKNIMRSLTKKYQRKIFFVDVTNKLKKLKEMNVNSQGKFGSYAAYSRFFITEYLPDYVDKILYIDCDTCVVNSLNELFSIDMKEYALAGILDILPQFHKKYINFSEQDNYYNSGVLLFNCEIWKKENYTNKIIEHIKNIKSNYSFHDQDLINIICKNKILTLSPKYMVFYPEYKWGEKNIRWLNGFNHEYYSNEELINALKEPIIIHYVDSIVGRPWYEDNINDYSRYWEEMKAKSPYDDSFTKIVKPSSIRHKILRGIYRYLPLSIFITIHKKRRNKLLTKREKISGIRGKNNETA